MNLEGSDVMEPDDEIIENQLKIYFYKTRKSWTGPTKFDGPWLPDLEGSGEFLKFTIG